MSPTVTNNIAEGETLRNQKTKGAVAEGDEQPMPQSLVKILVHAVFSTKNRSDLIVPEIEDGLFGYMHGIVENNKSKLILANGTANHVHLLISLGKTMDISELIGDIKRDNSVWIKEQGDFAGFYWQEGYGAFSYGHSQLNTIIRYLQNQERHHQRRSFKNEYLSFLRKFDIAFEDKYVFEFIE